MRWKIIFRIKSKLEPNLGLCRLLGGDCTNIQRKLIKLGCPYVKQHLSPYWIEGCNSKIWEDCLDVLNTPETRDLKAKRKVIRRFILDHWEELYEQ